MPPTAESLISHIQIVLDRLSKGVRPFPATGPLINLTNQNNDNITLKQLPSAVAGPS